MCPEGRCPAPRAASRRRSACAYRTRLWERAPSFALAFLWRRGIRHFLGRAEDAALVRLCDHIAAWLLAREHLFGVDLAIVLRLVAEAIGVRVVIPGALVLGDAVHDLKPDLGMLDADRNELRDVARADPEREPPLVDRLGINVADPDHEDLHAVLVGVQAAERLAEYLRDAVAAVGLRIDAMVDRLVAAIEAHGVVARRKDDALHAIAPRRLEDVVAADDV